WSANFTGELGLGYATTNANRRSLRQGDVDYDGDVDGNDVGYLSVHYGTTLPAPPTAANSLTASAATGTDAIMLTWNPPAAPATFDGFHVYRSSDGGVLYAMVKELRAADLTPDPANGTYSWTDDNAGQGLGQGRKY